MIASNGNDEFETAKIIAAMIAEFREEWIRTVVGSVVEECEKVEESEFDPTRGNGRGPWWA